MDQHQILANLRATGLYVFSVGDLARVAGVKRDAASVYVHRMKSTGLVHAVERGKFAIDGDPFVVSTQLVVPSYVSFTTALYLHGRMEQVIDKIMVVTSRSKSGIRFMDMDIRFVKFDPKRVYGYRRVEKGESHVMLADLEKAVIDCLYLPRYASVSLVHEALKDGFEQDLLEEYTQKMGIEAVIRRCGFLLEHLGMKTKLEPNTKTPYKLNPTISKKGDYNSRWKIYINEELK